MICLVGFIDVTHLSGFKAQPENQLSDLESDGLLRFAEWEAKETEESFRDPRLLSCLQLVPCDLEHPTTSWLRTGAPPRKHGP